MPTATEFKTPIIQAVLTEDKKPRFYLRGHALQPVGNGSVRTWGRRGIGSINLAASILANVFNESIAVRFAGRFAKEVIATMDPQKGFELYHDQLCQIIEQYQADEEELSKSRSDVVKAHNNLKLLSKEDIPDDDAHDETVECDSDDEEQSEFVEEWDNDMLAELKLIKQEIDDPEKTELPGMPGMSELERKAKIIAIAKRKMGSLRSIVELTAIDLLDMFDNDGAPGCVQIDGYRFFPETKHKVKIEKVK